MLTVAMYTTHALEILKNVYSCTHLSLTFTNAFPCAHRHAHTLTYQQCPKLKLKSHLQLDLAGPKPGSVWAGLL